MTVEWTNETNTGDKSMKGIKEMKEEGDKWRYERNHILLNFSRLLH
jgi:hypothetical protein